MSGLYRFQDIWLSKDIHKEWLLKDINYIRNAKCLLCQKSFSITSMGEAALKSHSKAASHARAVRQVQSSKAGIMTIKSFVTKSSQGEGNHHKIPQKLETDTCGKVVCSINTAYCSKRCWL